VLGRRVDDPHVVDGLDGVAGADRLGEVVAGVEEQHVDTGAGLRRQLDEHRVLHVGRDDQAVERPGGPGEHLLRRGVRSEFFRAALGERAQIDFGSKTHLDTSGTPIPIIFSENVRRQAAQYQAPCDASDGRRSSSPQYGQ
jgi:hypothetical protein